MPASAVVTRTLSDLPQPDGKIPLLGHLLKIPSDKIHQVLESWSVDYGGLYKIDLAGKVVVVISNPDMVSDILCSRPKSVNRSKKLGRIFKEQGIEGLFIANGEVWKRQRKLIVSCFSRKNLITFFPVLQQITDSLCHRFIQSCNATTEGAIEISIYDELRRFTVDVITSLLFGHDQRFFARDSAHLHKYLAVICPQLNARIFALFPYWRFVKLKKDRELDKALGKVKKLALEMVDQARTALQENPHLISSPENILQAMILATVGDGDDHLSNEELIANIVQLILAGEETTSSLIAWMLHLLSRRPDIQQAIYEELNQVYSECNGRITVSEVDSLRAVEALAREALRLKSPVPMIFAETAEKITLSDGTELPESTLLALLTRIGGLNTKYFHNGRPCHSDPGIKTGSTHGCSYDGSQQGSGKENATHFPFGGGARRCPGEGLALLEAKMVVATICQYFDLLPSEPELAVEEEFSITVRPKNLKFILRSKQ